MNTHECVECKKIFEAWSIHKRKYCSYSCYHKHIRNDLFSKFDWEKHEVIICGRVCNKWRTKIPCTICGEYKYVGWGFIRENYKKNNNYLYACKNCYGWKFTGSNSVNWTGGKLLDKNGYIIITINKDDPYFCMCNVKRKISGRVPEHRYVYAKSLGRPLKEWEHIHHKNQIKHDNRLENLELVSPEIHATYTNMERIINKLQKENTKLRKQVAGFSIPAGPGFSSHSTQ